MGLLLRDSEHHTYAEYLTWPDELRYELIEGRAYAMAPAPSVSHQEVVGALYRQVADALDASDCRVLVAPIDVRLPDGNEDDARVETVVQPDLLVVCDPAKVDERGVRGAPDWVVEVLSPATAVHDHERKRRIYERHGVREYWLVHPVERMLMLYRLEGELYGKPHVEELVNETAVGVLTSVRIDWSRVTRRLPRTNSPAAL
jgi:Uma2 family endonuclease